MKKRTIRVISVCLLLAMVFSVSAFAALPYGSSSTYNGVSTNISASSVAGDNTYEHVYVTVSKSSASSVGASVWYYNTNDTIFASNGDSASASWYKFDFKVKWDLLKSGYYAVARGNGTVSGTSYSGKYVSVYLA